MGHRHLAVTLAIFLTMHSKQVSSTAYNDQSSRSHTLCRLLVESSPNSADTAGPGVVTTRTTAWLTLVDLAGADTCSQLQPVIYIIWALTAKMEQWLLANTPCL